MEQSEYPIGTEHNFQNIDQSALTNDHLLIDKWLDGHGIRLYRFEITPTDHPPVFVGTSYTREIDKETGETIEQTQIETVGHATIHIDVRAGRVADHFNSIDAVEPRGIHNMIGYLESHIEEQFETVDVSDIQYNRTPGGIQIRAGPNIETVSDQLYETFQGPGDSTDWHMFLHDGLNDMDRTTVVYTFPSLAGPLNTDGFDVFNGDMYYNPTHISFEPVDNWILRYIENHYCGMYPSDNIAAIEAMMHDENIDTQSEMADILEVTESAVSQWKTKIEQHYSDMQWMCENRLTRTPYPQV